MRYYFAPMEGITGYVYRRAHHDYYPGLDRYYTPFIVPKEKRHLNTRERQDVLPEHNVGMDVIPQILTNKPEEFLRIARVLQQEYGYREVNLNLGCPSKTVVSKHRGAGFLAMPEELDAFFDKVCSGLGQMRLSVKTRIGKSDPQEFEEILAVYKRYPICELIVHPRIQTDFYKNTPNLEAFSKAYEVQSVAWELCYNGDLNAVEDCTRICGRFPGLHALMFGRGMLANPALAIEVRENRGAAGTLKTQRFLDDRQEEEERKRRYEFYRRLLEDYCSVMDGEKNVLFKMKELWLYMSQDFTQPERYWKRMKKANRLADFVSAADALCREQRLRDMQEE